LDDDRVIRRVPLVVNVTAAGATDIWGSQISIDPICGPPELVAWSESEIPSGNWWDGNPVRSTPADVLNTPSICELVPKKRKALVPLDGLKSVPSNRGNTPERFDQTKTNVTRNVLKYLIER
jgi:hypothetical protein